MKRAEAAVSAFKGAQDLKRDIRSYQGLFCTGKIIWLHDLHLFLQCHSFFLLLFIYCKVPIMEMQKFTDFDMNLNISGLVHTYLALSKIKEALCASREAMRFMPQSAKALKLVGDVHASNSGGREKVTLSSLLFKIKTSRLLS